MLQLLDWQSDGSGALAALTLYGLALLAFVLPHFRRSGVLTTLIPRALAWRVVIWAFYAFWQLPYYMARTGSDSSWYHSEGMKVAQSIRDGAWGDISWGLGTPAMPIITGFLYAPFGGNIYGMLVFSAVVGFCAGLYFCRAFSLWATPAQLKTYSLIVLFLPSFTTWTSIFGKDSWVALGLGLAAYGYSALLKSHSAKTLTHLLGGMAIVTVVRPHIAVVLAGSGALAYLLGLAYRRSVSIFAKVGTALALIATFILLAGVARTFLDLSDVSANGMQGYARDRGAANVGGGSDVEVNVAPGIAGVLLAFPRGIVRILFEPFPWAVRSLGEGLAAIENVLIAFLLATRATHIRGILSGIAGNPYGRFSALLACGLLLILSLFANLGILSRQRCQLLPFLFVAVLSGESNMRGMVPRARRRVSGRTELREMAGRVVVGVGVSR
jgi:hypothetical protein